MGDLVGALRRAASVRLGGSWRSGPTLPPPLCVAIWAEVLSGHEAAPSAPAYSTMARQASAKAKASAAAERRGSQRAEKPAYLAPKILKRGCSNHKR